MCCLLKLLVTSLLLVQVLNAAPVDDKFDSSKYEQNEGEDLIEGDIITHPGMRNGRNLIKHKGYIWPNGQLYYTLSSSAKSHSTVRSRISDAVNHLNSRLRGCIRLTETSNSRQKSIYVAYKHGGCSASVGYFKNNDLKMNIFERCSTGSVMHEFMHSLGMLHEQSRSDRDSYVRINYGNIKSGRERNFKKADAGFFGEFGTPYDYGSIMHYGAYYFSKNGRETITKLRSGPAIGQRDKPSDLDILKLKKMYGCA